MDAVKKNSFDKSTFSQAVAIGILTAVLSGLLLFLFKFFMSVFPKTENRITVIEKRIESHGISPKIENRITLNENNIQNLVKNVENKFKANDVYLQKIDDRTQKIYEILINRK